MSRNIQMTRADAEAHQRKHGFFIGVQSTADRLLSLPKLIKSDMMNKTEREFSLILEAMKRRGEIIRWEYEGITLRWRDRETDELIRYTPDFDVWRNPSALPEGDNPWALQFIEVKGGFALGKFERAVERFRHARTYWSQFAFEMHQKKGGQWSRLH